MAEIEHLGGMTRAIEAGLPKSRIEESAAKRQALIDQGYETIVGVNKYQLPEQAPIDTLEIDNTAVREAQVSRLIQIKARRDFNPGCGLSQRFDPGSRIRRRQLARLGHRSGPISRHGG